MTTAAFDRAAGIHQARIVIGRSGGSNATDSKPRPKSVGVWVSGKRSPGPMKAGATITSSANAASTTPIAMRTGLAIPSGAASFVSVVLDSVPRIEIRDAPDLK